MVPYVRKSYWKHYRTGLKYIANLEIRWEKDFNHIESHPEEYPICLPGYTDGIASEHPKVVQYAYDMTKKEIHQAVEGLYHNLSKFGRLNRNIKNIAI